MTETTKLEEFALGEPVLVCRWRLAARHLPLANRHLRALLAREVGGEPVPKELVAWVKQHIEWTLEQGAAAHPDGVLMLAVDGEGRAAMSVGPYQALADTTLDGLVARAEMAQAEAASTHVPPETLWLAHDGCLLWDPGEMGVASGSASLIGHLAQTLGLSMQRWEGLLDGVVNGAIVFDEAFLVSDEHGVVPASDARGAQGERFAQGYRRLLERGDL